MPARCKRRYQSMSIGAERGADSDISITETKTKTEMISFNFTETKTNTEKIWKTETI